MKLNDRAVSILEKYELTIEKTKKGRGAIIADTDKGMKILTEYQGYREKVDFLERIMEEIRKNGFPFIDCFLRNKEGQIITTDYTGKAYVVKDYLQGTECNVKDLCECRMVVSKLGQLHSCMQGLPLECPQALASEHLIQEFHKKNAQLKRVRTNVRKSPAKTDFELLFLKVYDEFIKQSDKAMSYLSGEICDALCQKILKQETYCHGDCSHHNLLVENDHVNIMNFEKCKPDTQIKDLALFVRKVLEKNNWEQSFGMEIIESYNQLLPLSKEEFSYLFARLCYPEKFVKIAGSYLNQRRSLPAKKQQEKLNTLLCMEEARLAFLQAYEKEYM